MRQIKFRAWDKEFKKMRQVHQITFDKKTTLYPPHILDESNDIQLLSEIELMQFTGRTDIHNIEIYEGDIVRGICSTNLAYVCEGLKEAGMMGKEIIGVVRYSDLYGQFYVTTDGITYLAFHTFHTGTTYLEVIGNEFENKKK